MDDMKKLAVLGLGKVGHLAAELLADAGFEVTGVDQRTNLQSTLGNVVSIDVADRSQLAKVLGTQDAVVSCLPYHLNMTVAEVAHDLDINYFDLSEDVPTTQRIRELSKTSEKVMAPQCGLAPGFIAIAGADLVAKFASCRSLRLRVGALPQNPTGMLGYAFNWSPKGVVNEYLNDCEVIEEGVHKWVSPMEWKEAIFIEGNELEAFTTSGGLGTICETYLGVVDNIDYKTIRYPGHVDLMNFFFHELLMREQRDLAGEILTNAKPPVNDDVVLVHVSAEGTMADSQQLFREEFVRSYQPKELLGKHRTAIAWTTAGSLTSVVEMVANGMLPNQGFLKQEEIPLEKFLETNTGQLFLTEQ